MGNVVRIPSIAPSAKYRLKMEELFETCHIRQDVFTRMEQIVVHFPDGPAVTTPFNIRMQARGGSIYAEAKRDGRKTEPTPAARVRLPIAGRQPTNCA